MLRRYIFQPIDVQFYTKHSTNVRNIHREKEKWLVPLCFSDVYWIYFSFLVLGSATIHVTHFQCFSISPNMFYLQNIKVYAHSTSTTAATTENGEIDIETYRYKHIDNICTTGSHSIIHIHFLF